MPTPFTVIATLQQGAALDARFGIGLDGLLASVIRDHAKHTHGAPGEPLSGSTLDGGLALATPTTVDLPLTRCTPPDAPDQWHWSCTTALPVDHDRNPVRGDPDVHHHHGRIKERTAELVAHALPTAFPPASGRYRMRRMPVVTFPAAALIWRAVGNPDTVHDLLADIPTIGARRGTGEGTVLRWAVEPAPDADPYDYGHLHPDRNLGRPTPLGCLTPTTGHTLTGTSGIRPPYWHPHTQHHVALPRPLQGATDAPPT